MTITNARESKGIVSFLLDLPLLRRIKIVKDLIIGKFDFILSHLDSIKDLLIDQFNKLTTRIDQLDQKTNALLENDTPLLQAAIHCTESLQSVQKDGLQNFSSVNQSLQELREVVIENQGENQQRYQSLTDSFENLQKENQQFYQSLAESVQKGLSSIELLSQQFVTILEDQSNSKIIVDSEQKFDVEAGLMAHLYSYLPSPLAIDIGANIGNISESLLKVGYEVYAFEPFPPIFSKLSDRLAKYSNFHASNFAVGSADETSTLHIAIDKTDDNIYGDTSIYNSLIPHYMLEDLVFTDTDTVPVTVRTLESLHNSLEIPANVSLVKIDTEGFDLEVIRGMGSYRYPVVVTEFWDERHPFGTSKTFSKLEDTVKEMRQRKYLWYIVIYRLCGNDDKISFYCNYPRSLRGTWGNIVFFQDYNIFTQALNWCSVMLPITYIKNS